VVPYLLAVGVSSRTSRAARSRPARPYLEVFRFAGCTAFIAYSVALWQDSIWYKAEVEHDDQDTIDGFIYGLLTAGIFGWLWPK